MAWGGVLNNNDDDLGLSKKAVDQPRQFYCLNQDAILT